MIDTEKQPHYTQAELLEFLDQHGIQFSIHFHPAVYTIADADKYTGSKRGFHAKNLFLSNQKGDHLYLLVTHADHKTDLRQLAKTLHDTRLHFCTEEKLMQYLGLTPGAVTPLALINDFEHRVQALFAQDAWDAPQIMCHPLVNTATLILDHDDLSRFLELVEHKVIVV